MPSFNKYLDIIIFIFFGNTLFWGLLTSFLLACILLES